MTCQVDMWLGCHPQTPSIYVIVPTPSLRLIYLKMRTVFVTGLLFILAIDVIKIAASSFEEFHIGQDDLSNDNTLIQDEHSPTNGWVNDHIPSSPHEYDIELKIILLQKYKDIDPAKKIAFNASTTSKLLLKEITTDLVEKLIAIHEYLGHEGFFEIVKQFDLQSTKLDLDNWINWDLGLWIQKFNDSIKYPEHTYNRVTELCNIIIVSRHSARGFFWDQPLKITKLVSHITSHKVAQHMRVQRHLMEFNNPKLDHSSEEGGMTLFVPNANMSAFQLKMPVIQASQKFQKKLSYCEESAVSSKKKIYDKIYPSFPPPGTVPSLINAQKILVNQDIWLKDKLAETDGSEIQKYQSSHPKETNIQESSLDLFQCLRNLIGPLRKRHHLLLIALLWTAHALLMFIPQFYIQKGIIIPNENLSLYRFSRMNGRFLASLLKYTLFFGSFHPHITRAPAASPPR